MEGHTYLEFTVSPRVHRVDFDLTRAELVAGTAGALIREVHVVREGYNVSADWEFHTRTGVTVPVDAYAVARDFEEAGELAAAHLGVRVLPGGGWLFGAMTPTYRVRIEEVA